MKWAMTMVLATTVATWGAESFEVHGHRGAMALRPENTIPAFQEAIRARADFIELDVYSTKDGVLVITHDPQINLAICQGAGGKRPIIEMTLAEVRSYDCGLNQPKLFPRQIAVPGARIPTLDEVLDLAKASSKIRFNIEIKSSEKMQALVLPPDEISRKVVEAVRKHKLDKRAMIQSFDFRVVKATRAIAPDITVAALYGPGERDFVDIAKENDVKLVTPNFKLVTPEKVNAAHAAGVRVIPWTVDAPEDWERMIAAGVDGIITNDPGGLVELLKQKKLR
ncbi:MAG TPA: glycerophosphodiester phosphodiesterase [Bryobacteraceae bacterium]|nr:glycerophosphodiester phosphodiesterase [Bryobacteraceae bacterium]